MIFLDANIFIYALGTNHPLKRPCARVMEFAAIQRQLFTNAEVMQELLHRYKAQQRWVEKESFVQDIFELLQGRITEMTAADVNKAGELALTHTGLSARDLIHVAIMHRVGSEHIVSADKDFDVIDAIQRLDPMRIDEWAPQVTAS